MNGARHIMRKQAHRGVGLIEVIIAMTLAGVVLGAIWGGWVYFSAHSADPLVSRQSLAVANSLLREIELQPMPGNGAVSGNGPGRTGYASIANYDNLSLVGITDVEGQPIAGLSAYQAGVLVKPMALAGVPAASGWWIEVVVTGPNGAQTKLAQWRAQR